MTDELIRLVSLAKIGSAPLDFLVRATADECRAVAIRMDIPAIQSLECQFRLTAETDGASIHADCHLRARLTRVCVVSAEDFETAVEETFTLRFVPSGQERDDPDPDLPDEIGYDGDSIDLGEATAEQLGLALDPYPKMEGATLPDIGDEPNESPFAALARRSS